MRNLRSRFERFCYRNRDRGIPHLILFITIGCAVVYLFSQLSQNYMLYNLLCFNREAILHGQVWRLFTYVFTYQAGNILLTLVAFYCFTSIGLHVENVWGTLRFNLYYFTGIILMDVYAMLFGGTANIFDLNLTLLLAYATLYPNAQFLIFFIIPIRARIMALIYLVLMLIDVLSGSFPSNLFSVVAFANYFLFFGKDIWGLLPPSWAIKAHRLFRKKNSGDKRSPHAPQRPPIQFRQAETHEKPPVQVKAPYTHRCTVCGRTDITNPDLEFRYCSRCQGYHCYCEEHIGNHTHIQ